VIALAVFLVVSLSVGMGCDRQFQSPSAGGSGHLVVTQIPPRSGDAPFPDRLSPAVRYPETSRIAFVPLEGDTDGVRILSRNLYAAGAPSVSFDGRSVLFAGRVDESSAWTIFEADLWGSGLRTAIEAGPGDCFDPTYAANDEIIFVCVDHDPCCGRDTRSQSLYSASRTRCCVERITYGPGSALDPYPLRDGRVLFSMWQASGSGRPAEGATALFVANPDGTLLDAFAGSHRGPVFKVRARETYDGGVVYLTADRERAETSIERVEMRLPSRTHRAMEFSPAGFRPESVEPLPDGAILVAGRVAAGEGRRATSAVYRAPSAGGDLDVVFDDPNWDEVEAVSAIPREEPGLRPGHLYESKSTENFGTLLCYDANRTDGRFGPPKGSAKASILRISQAWPATPSELMVAAELPGYGLYREVELGKAVIERDGSFFVEVPSDVPLRVTTLDADREEIATSEWFWVRRGEVRACFGCHEGPEAMPINRPLEALTRRPVRLQTVSEELVRAAASTVPEEAAR
jgi:hypothetical protein